MTSGDKSKITHEILVGHPGQAGLSSSAVQEQHQRQSDHFGLTDFKVYDTTMDEARQIRGPPLDPIGPWTVDTLTIRKEARQIRGPHWTLLDPPGHIDGAHQRERKTA